MTLSNCSSRRCGELTEADIGKQVTISGWLEFKRGNTFFTLRDATGNCQILSPSKIDLPAKESVLQVQGTVQGRPEKDRNTKMATGNIEINCSDVQILNKCKHFRFPVKDYWKSNEHVRMKYRYIDLRNKDMQYNLRLRSKFLLKLRRFLCEEHRFIDVETPTLFRKTPGGAKEFVVPTQTPGYFYSLPQSPQQFKQLLMVGAIDRYMQIAKCYRDEGSRPDRQPEFTQLDLELSFTSPQKIKTLVENMITSCWPEHLPPVTATFARMSYHDAMQNYGVDKPDTRYGCLLIDVTEEFSQAVTFHSGDVNQTVRAINIKDGVSKLNSTQIKSIQKDVEKHCSLKIGVVKVEDGGHWNSPLAKLLGGVPNLQTHINQKLEATDGDLLFVCAHSSWNEACNALGKCRTQAALHCDNNGKPLYDTEEQMFNFLWVEDFPMFEIENSTYQSAHHPFTAPLEEDLPLLYTDPGKARGQHYDLVLNGNEIGGGSMRIHNSDVQRYVLETVLQENTSQLEHLLEALDSGCPPHGGIALGLDRLVSIMCNVPSIRDVIAFPKSRDGFDLMTDAPCQMKDNELETYHITVTD